MPRASHGEPELPALYPGVQWEATFSGTIELPRQLPNGNVKVDLVPALITQSVLLTVLPRADAVAFVAYYDRDLRKRGWAFNILYVGQGIDSEHFGYESGGRVFLFGYRPIYSGGVPGAGYRLGYRMYTERY